MDGVHLDASSATIGGRSRPAHSIFADWPITNQPRSRLIRMAANGCLVGQSAKGGFGHLKKRKLADVIKRDRPLVNALCFEGG